MDDRRAGLIVRDLLDSLRDVIRRHGVTYPEYRRAVGFVLAAAERGELPLLCDVLLEAAVEEADGSGRRTPGVTDSNVEGPFFAAGAPELGGSGPDGGPIPLPMRTDEPGDGLVFSGIVRSIDGTAVPGAVLDLWQADAGGRYLASPPGCRTGTCGAGSPPGPTARSPSAPSCRRPTTSPTNPTPPASSS